MKFQWSSKVFGSRWDSEIERAKWSGFHKIIGKMKTGCKMSCPMTIQSIFPNLCILCEMSIIVVWRKTPPPPNPSFFLSLNVSTIKYHLPNSKAYLSNLLFFWLFILSFDFLNETVYMSDLNHFFNFIYFSWNLKFRAFRMSFMCKPRPQVQTFFLFITVFHFVRANIFRSNAFNL